MGPKWLISGSPGCGKTTWILNTIKNHQGACGYLRLTEQTESDHEQLAVSQIDYTFLKDPVPHLEDFSDCRDTSISQHKDCLTLIELSNLKGRENIAVQTESLLSYDE